MKRRNAAFLLALLAAISIGLVVWQRMVPDAALRRVQQSATIRIGYAVEAPYAFVTPEGRVTGESPETARLVAERLGLKVEWVQTEFDNLIADLKDDRFDLIAAGMFVTRERAKQVDFTEPTLRVSAGLLVPEGNPRGLSSYDGLLAAGAGLHIAVLSGSVEEQRLKALGLPSAALLSMPDARSACVAVATGEADALALSLPTIRLMTCGERRLSAVRVVEHADAEPGRAPPDDYVAFAFAPDHAALRELWNAGQSAVIGSDAHLAAITPFGFTREDLPRGITLARILAP